MPPQELRHGKGIRKKTLNVMVFWAMSDFAFLSGYEHNGYFLSCFYSSWWVFRALPEIDPFEEFCTY